MIQLKTNQENKSFQGFNDMLDKVKSKPTRDESATPNLFNYLEESPDIKHNVPTQLSTLFNRKSNLEQSLRLALNRNPFSTEIQQYNTVQQVEKHKEQVQEMPSITSFRSDLLSKSTDYNKQAVTERSKATKTKKKTVKFCVQDEPKEG